MLQVVESSLNELIALRRSEPSVIVERFIYVTCSKLPTRANVTAEANFNH
jgi:hypothetical protein